MNLEAIRNGIVGGVIGVTASALYYNQEEVRKRIKYHYENHTHRAVEVVVGGGIGAAIGGLGGALVGASYVLGSYIVGYYSISPTIDLAFGVWDVVTNYPVLVSGLAGALAAATLVGGGIGPMLFGAVLSAGHAYNIEFFMEHKVPYYTAITGTFAGLIGGPALGISVGVLKFIGYDQYYHENQLVQDPYITCAIKAVAITGIGAAIGGPVGALLGATLGIANCADELKSTMLSNVATAIGFIALPTLLMQAGWDAVGPSLLSNTVGVALVASAQEDVMISSLLFGAAGLLGIGYSVMQLNDIDGAFDV